MAVLLIYMKSVVLIYTRCSEAIHGHKSATPKQYISKFLLTLFYAETLRMQQRNFFHSHGIVIFVTVL